MKLVDTIGLRYQDMTVNERRIFDCMAEDTKGFALRSIGDVAKELEISKTTLMRFAKGCGFTGYADFKRALQQDVLLNFSPVHKLEKAIDNKYDLCARELYEREVENLKATFEGQDEIQLTRLVELVCSSQKINTLSWGISGHLAEIFALRLQMTGIRCTTITRKHGTLVEETALLTGDDLLIVFDIQPYSQQILEAVKKLYDRGVQIVVVTDSSRCPLTEYGVESFFCPTGAMFFGNSLVGPLFWINLVSSMVMYRVKDKALDFLEEQQKIFNDTRYYCK